MVDGMIPLAHMSRDKANEILTFWKLGIEFYPPAVIRLALYVTGDLESML